MRNLLLLLLAVLLVACEKPKLPSPFHANDVTPIFTGADFHLTDHNGKPRTLADFRGKVVVLFFGYTHCPDVCPTTLIDLAQVMQLLGKDAERVQALFVPSFHPSFLALYGDEQATAQATKAFYVGYQKQPTSSGYTMDHTMGTFLIDPNGKVRLSAAYTQRADWQAEDIRLLLAGG